MIHVLLVSTILAASVAALIYESPRTGAVTTGDAEAAYPPAAAVDASRSAEPIGMPAGVASPVHQLASSDPAQPDALYIYDLTQPALAMPLEMAKMAGIVWLGCEVKGRVYVAYGDLAGAIGAAGERGQAQLHPIHRAGMTKRGLDFEREKDRVWYAINVIWKSQGWLPWSCQPE